MLAIARRNAIQEQLQEHKSVTITDLAAKLNVTKETIRRDLRAMEEGGELIRTHGGAYILEGVQNDIDISTRQVLRTEEKQVIAQKCAALVQAGDSIYLDGSTTAWCIARTLTERRLTVVTTSLEIANIFAESKSVHLIVIGGEFSASTRSFEGDGAMRNLQMYFVDKAFISCRSVSMEQGLTDTNDTNAALHRLALEHAKQKILAVDHTKLDFNSFSRICPVEQVDAVVLDRSFPAPWQEFLKQKGVAFY